jgi:hypothetical protein
MTAPTPEQFTPASFLKRLAWLLACICIGLLIGITGSAVTGNEIWYAAVPAIVAIGWLFFADPSQCDPAVRHEMHHRDKPETEI